MTVQTQAQSNAQQPSWEDLESSLKLAISAMPEEQLAVLEKQILPAAEAANRDKLSTYRPYPKQIEFHNTGKKYRERLLMAGNQLGKTLAASREAAMHATGRYPDWFQGQRFDRPTIGWVAGISAEQTRDNAQRLLLGRDQQWGTEAIPAECIIGEPVMGRSVAGAVDYVRVRHVSGANSLVGFKTYEKGREKWQGDTLDWMWFDEEPPLDVYTEGVTRTNRTLGPVFMTFTPLMGETAVVKRYKTEQSPDRVIISMTLDDAYHYSADARHKIEMSYPEHEREARARGIPVLGSGLVFAVARSVIEVPAFEVPPHWPAIGGLDFGWDHPTAAVKHRWDKDADVIYVTNCYRQRQQTPLVHAAAVKSWDGGKEKLPWAWPHDGLQHDKGSGEQLKTQYENHGLAMLSDRATFEDGSFGVEAGVTDMLDRMKTGRWKVFSHLHEWFGEFTGYHRKDGLIVKTGDDLMSASRYAYMMRRHASVIEELQRDRYASRDRYNKQGARSGSPMAA